MQNKEEANASSFMMRVLGERHSAMEAICLFT